MLAVIRQAQTEHVVVGFLRQRYGAVGQVRGDSILA